MPHADASKVRFNPSRPSPPSPPCLLLSLHRFVLSGDLRRAVSLLPALARRGLRPDIGLISSLLYSCLRSRSLALARDVHLHLKLTGLRKSIPSHTVLSNHILALHFECRRPDEARALFDRMTAKNVFSYNAMLSGYAKLGMPAAARRLFERMSERDVVSWNTVVIALARGGLCRDAVEFYVRMRRECDGYNAYTFSGVLSACVRTGQLPLASQFHGQVFRIGFLENAVIASSLLDAYVKCGNVEDARKLFDAMVVADVYAWTTMVSGYAKRGDLIAARELFDAMPEKNPVSWSSMISGYVHGGFSLDALQILGKMVIEGVRPDQFVISSGLCACASIASIKGGKQIHAYLTRKLFHPNAIALSALIDMYSKCGELAASQRIFYQTPDHKRDTILWNTMISAFGQHGNGRMALEVFQEMIKAGTILNSNTFIVTLTACSHSGLVGEGIRIFKSMSQDHGIDLSAEHHACFVDLLGRAGLFKEAKDWINSMPSQSNILVWKALLGGCRIHGNIELGIEAAEHLIELEPQQSAPYVLLSSMYTEIGRWDSAEKIRYLMEKRNVKKERAISYFEIDNFVHTFGVFDKSHPSILDICAILEQLACHVEDDISMHKS